MQHSKIFVVFSFLLYSGGILASFNKTDFPHQESRQIKDRQRLIGTSGLMLSLSGILQKGLVRKSLWITTGMLIVGERSAIEKYLRTREKTIDPKIDALLEKAGTVYKMLRSGMQIFHHHTIKTMKNIDNNSD
jgi:hypothetical protein